MRLIIQRLQPTSWANAAWERPFAARYTEMGCLSMPLCLHDANPNVKSRTGGVCGAGNDTGLRDAYNALMVTRIGPKQPRRHFLKAWREKRGLTQEQLAERLGTHKGQISNWENYRRDITLGVQMALAEALGMDNPGDIFRDPSQPSADELMRSLPPDAQKQVLDFLHYLRDRKAG